MTHGGKGQKLHTVFKRAEAWSLVCLLWADSLPPQITVHNMNRKLGWTNLIWNKLVTASYCESQRSYELVMISIWHFYRVLNVAIKCSTLRKENGLYALTSMLTGLVACWSFIPELLQRCGFLSASGIFPEKGWVNSFGWLFHIINFYTLLPNYLRTGSFAKAESNVRINTFQSDLNFFWCISCWYVR